MILAHDIINYYIVFNRTSFLNLKKSTKELELLGLTLDFFWQILRFRWRFFELDSDLNLT